MKLPYFCWYPADAETDANFRDMDFAAKGFYLCCLNYAWINGGVPEDPSKRARALGTTRRIADRLWEQVKPAFVPDPSNLSLLVNPRQQKERGKSELRSRSAQQSAAQRWDSVEVKSSDINKDSMRSQCEGNARATRASDSEDKYVSSSASVVSSSEEQTTPEVSPAPPLKVETLSPLEAKIQFIAKAIHDRHPAIRRCPISHVLKKLRTITNKFPASERIELLSSIDRNHQGMCDSEQWAKDAGEFAKGLDNWLAPSKDYWAQPPPEKHRTLSKSEQSLVSAAQIFESGIMNIGGRKQ